MVCIGLLANNAHASETVESITMDIPCFDTETLVKELRGKFKEIPFIYGKASDVAETAMTMWVNPLAKTWTLVATKDSISCVIGYGKDVQIIPYVRGTNV
jgi:hypothetical protein